VTKPSRADVGFRRLWQEISRDSQCFLRPAFPEIRLGHGPRGQAAARRAGLEEARIEPALLPWRLWAERTGPVLHIRRRIRLMRFPEQGVLLDARRQAGCPSAYLVRIKG